MDYLLEFGARDDVRELAARYLSFRSVHAIDIGLDQRWLTAWRTQEDALGLDDDFVAYPFGVDTSWRPSSNLPLIETWERYGPFVITVVLRPSAVQDERGGLAEVDGPEDLLVTFESQPVPRLLAGGKSAVRPLVGGLGLAGASGPPATLGGIVTSASGEKFAVTCAHVLGQGEEVLQPAPIDNRREAVRIGVCSHRSRLRAHESPVSPYDADLNEVDAALVALDGGVRADLAMLEAGPLAGISRRSDLHEHISVDIVGLRAKRRSLRVGKLRLYGEFSHGRETFGYQNLFELRRRSRFFGLTGTFGPPVSGGDSGAWVLRPGAPGPEWAGVVVAGEGPTAYAVMAASVVEWMERDTPLRSVAVA